jgi:hypothetical protein
MHIFKPKKKKTTTTKQTKTNKEMLQHDFQFFRINKKNDQIFPFHICAQFQTKKKKKTKPN